MTTLYLKYAPLTPMKVAIQGGPGSFHAAVATRILGHDIELVFCDTFAEVFGLLAVGTADKGVVANENSLFGSIREVNDLLLQHRFPVVAEAVEHIHQQLICLPGATLADIREVYSHPVALDQCRRYLETVLPHAKIIEYHDTAEAVLFIKEATMTHAAAIAGTVAAELYDMPILDSNIENEPTNLTKFIVLDPSNTAKVAGANRALIVLTTDNALGALFRALGVFAKHDINLTKLESRPIRGEAFRYQFFIDADAAQLKAASKELTAQGCSVLLLGHYQAATINASTIG